MGSVTPHRDAGSVSIYNKRFSKVPLDGFAIIADVAGNHVILSLTQDLY